ncbi:MAG: response regulator [Fusobacteriaceae bacterium]|nr:response regulator [Fusobacteriaceae bacterium]MBP6467216.1 response regulator [Fusobacteriaceae bacterium]MBU9918812.1 response regulator [Fusobacteriaceae bacterium]
MKQGALILIIDDEIQIRRFLKMSLAAYGYSVREAENGEEGFRAVFDYNPDLIILDLELPDTNGLDLLKKIRISSSIPVIVLTVCDDERDKITLLDSGADDYLTKPFSVGELNARIKVALRHSINFANEENIFIKDNLSIDFSKRIVMKNNIEIKLTPTEYSILSILVKNSGKVVTQTHLLKEIWGPNLIEETQYLRIYIMQLRRKVENDSSNPEFIITEPGVGYRFIGN